jgi:hypothetical protein
MIDLDDLKAEWVKRDLALAAAIQNNGNLLRTIQLERHLDQYRRANAWRNVGFVVRITLSIGFLALFGAFMGRNFGAWRFFIPAALLHLWTIVDMVVAIREHLALRAIDLGGPPAEVQKCLAKLRLQRARSMKWRLLTGQILWWIPFAIVLFKGLLGVDLYNASPFMSIFMAINVMAGLVLIPLVLFVGHRIRPKLAGSSFSRMVIDAITGHDLAAARATAQRIEDFIKPVTDIR